MHYEPTDQEAGFDIILNIGQSNTHYGEPLDSSIQEIDSSIFQLGRGVQNMQVVQAIEPLDHATKHDNAIGFAMTFARLYSEYCLHVNRKLLIIPCGYAGSSFQEGYWRQGQYAYNDAIVRTKYCLDSLQGSKLSAILWHQGESDEGNESYQNDLDQMIINMRADLGAIETPFILGGMVPHWVEEDSARISIQEIIQDTPSRIEHCAYASPNSPSVIQKAMPDSNSIHYDAENLIELGKRYFGAYISIM